MTSRVFHCHHRRRSSGKSERCRRRPDVRASMSTSQRTCPSSSRTGSRSSHSAASWHCLSDLFDSVAHKPPQSGLLIWSSARSCFSSRSRYYRGIGASEDDDARAGVLPAEACRAAGPSDGGAEVQNDVLDAEARLDELRQRNEADGPLFKLRDEPRLTPVGKLLRRTSIDELPSS